MDNAEEGNRECTPTKEDAGEAKAEGAPVADNVGEGSLPRDDARETESGSHLVDNADKVR